MLSDKHWSQSMIRYIVFALVIAIIAAAVFVAARRPTRIAMVAIILICLTMWGFQAAGLS